MVVAVEQLVEVVAQAAVVVTSDGQLVHRNSAACRLEERCPGWTEDVCADWGRGRARSGLRFLELGEGPGDHCLLVIPRIDLEVKEAAGSFWAVGWGLSPRHAKVAALLMQGHTDQEIASILGCALQTARTYVRSVFRKAGVGSRSALLPAASQFVD